MAVERRPRKGRQAWGEPQPGLVPRVVERVRRAIRGHPAREREALPQLPMALRRGELATSYLAAEQNRDHRRAGAAASQSMETALAAREWWPADLWAHRALWHFEQADMALAATRIARRIGDLRSAAGDPVSARRYYAEAIGEARDIGAEREEGLAALGLGRVELDLGDVTTARRLAAISRDLLARCGAPADERAAAEELLGVEKRVGDAQEDRQG